MIGKARFFVPGLVAAAALALAVQAQATSSGGHSDKQGHVEQTNAAQGHGGQGFTTSGLERLAAGTTHKEQPASGHGTGHQGLAAATSHGEQPAAGHGTGHWTYEGQTGPAHWGDLSAEFGACKVGRTQSPIDIKGGIAAAATPIAFDFGDSPLVLENNGHTVVSHYAPGSGITVEGKRFELLQFHFHAPSEHLINGRQAAMEIHFVHKNAQGQLAVVGVMVEQGEDNLALAEIWQHLPSHQSAKQAIGSILVNGQDLLPGNHAYFRYMGSLTTPPCSEGVNWFVLTTPIQASFKQIMRLAALFGPNNRPAQAVHNRMILVPFSAN